MEGTWSRVKKTKDAEVWRREANEEGFPPITKVLFNICYQFFTLLSIISRTCSCLLELLFSLWWLGLLWLNDMHY